MAKDNDFDALYHFGVATEEEARRNLAPREPDMTVDEIAKRVDEAIELLTPMRGNMDGDTSDETTIALGHALGSLVKARGLLLVDLAVIKRRNQRTT